MSARRITLCADDFALDAVVSSSILELAARGRISAVSCFADAPLWVEAGSKLLRHRGHVLIGLHFNLTQCFDEACTTLYKTILAAVTRRLDPMTVRLRLFRQIDRFTAVVGELPDFIDGHEHVHAFPVVADVVRRIADEASPEAPIPIRSINDFFGPTDAPLKRTVIRSLAALGGRETAGVRQIRLNTAFAGDYSLRAQSFGTLLKSWLAMAPDRALIMCHPGRAAAGDAASAGSEESRFLGSPAFANLFDKHSLRFLRRDELLRRTE
jgi:predicted glycoside hydrolase/deacetylase ChbG (UPF0249 family)